LIIASDFIPSAETIAICIFVKTGARNEDQSYNGLSHFLEHMAFKGTNTRTAKEIAEAFDSIGGQFNAYTSYEETVYYAKVLKDDWIIALDILTDIVQNSTYSPEEMDKERGVILQEMAQYQDMPDSVISDNFQETFHFHGIFIVKILPPTVIPEPFHFHGLKSISQLTAIHHWDLIYSCINEENDSTFTSSTPSHIDSFKFSFLILASLTSIFVFTNSNNFLLSIFKSGFCISLALKVIDCRFLLCSSCDLYLITILPLVFAQVVNVQFSYLNNLRTFL